MNVTETIRRIQRNPPAKYQTMSLHGPMGPSRPAGRAGGQRTGGGGRRPAALQFDFAPTVMGTVSNKVNTHLLRTLTYGG